MEWLNLHVSAMDSPQAVGSGPIERGTWVWLLRYCIGQENGGRIENCADWPDRKWQQLARVTKEEVMLKSDLWEWDGADLIVWAYPIEKQEEVQRLRRQAKTASKARWDKKIFKNNGSYKHAQKSER